MTSIGWVGKYIIYFPSQFLTQVFYIFRVNLKLARPTVRPTLELNYFIDLRLGRYYILCAFFEGLPWREFHWILSDLVPVNAKDT